VNRESIGLVTSGIAFGTTIWFGLAAKWWMWKLRKLESTAKRHAILGELNVIPTKDVAAPLKTLQASVHRRATIRLIVSTITLVLNATMALWIFSAEYPLTHLGSLILNLCWGISIPQMFLIGTLDKLRRSCRLEAQGPLLFPSHAV
jgi:hypothetical protein